MMFRYLLSLFLIVILISLMFVAQKTMATPTRLCGVDLENNCSFCIMRGCVIDNGHPEYRCRTGSSYLGWEPLGAQNASQIEACILTSLSYEEQYGGVNNCVRFDSDEEELPNGIDDNCDGEYLGDETCNGIDEDGDGLADNGVGSCIQRFLFVPYCWEKSPDEFEDAVKRWTEFFQRKSLLSDCGDLSDFNVQKLWFETAPVGAISCPATDSSGTLIEKLKTETDYDLREWDVIVFVTEHYIHGVYPGAASGNVILLKTGGSEEYKDGERVTFSHEYGHVLGLGEEYRVDSDAPNMVSAAYGCDPDTCCVYEHPDLPPGV